MKKNLTLTFLIILIIVSCQRKETNYILAIGDSHGAIESGWVNQLKKLRKNDSIINYCISGNTIGFNNLGRDTLNTLSNIYNYLKKGLDSAPYLDKIIVLLGTNDCKAVFDSMQSQVVKNLDSLIFIICNYPYPDDNIPEISLVSPPPAAIDSLQIPKYYGITGRLEKLIPEYPVIANKYKIKYIDIYTPMLNGFDTLNEDGIHLNEKGYSFASGIINKSL